MLPNTLSVHVLLDRLHQRTHFIRDQRLVLDRDAAFAYGVSAAVLRRAVSRNRERFPAGTLLHLPKKEGQYAFNAEGVLLLATIINSPQAIQTSIDVIRELHGYQSN